MAHSVRTRAARPAAAEAAQAFAKIEKKGVALLLAIAADVDAGRPLPVDRLAQRRPSRSHEFGRNVLQAPTKWIEPAWKMILSCKSILPLLYDRHPDSPYLLPASFEPIEGNYVRKPVHAREGANITVVIDGQTRIATDGVYTDGPSVYQALAPMKAHDGRYPVFGTWVVNGVACGLGIREDETLVTQNTSRFVPHQMVG